MGRQVLSSVNAALRPMHSSSETNARFLCTPVLALSLACLLRAWRPQAPLRSLFLSPSLSVSVSLILSSLLLLHSVPVSVCMCVCIRVHASCANFGSTSTASFSQKQAPSCPQVLPAVCIWEFPKIGVPYFGVLLIRILLFRALY